MIITVIVVGTIFTTKKCPGKNITQTIPATKTKATKESSSQKEKKQTKFNSTKKHTHRVGERERERINDKHEICAIFHVRKIAVLLIDKYFDCVCVSVGRGECTRI